MIRSIQCILRLTNTFKDKSKYILYLDYNSLYASVMCEPLPIGGISRLSESDMNKLISNGLESLATDGDVGYWILCDTKFVCEYFIYRSFVLIHK